MNKFERMWAMGLYWVPFVIGLGSVCTYISLLVIAGGDVGLQHLIISITGILVGLVAVEAAMLGAKDARGRRDEEQHSQELQVELTEVRDQAEVLQAMSKVTRILSEAVDLKQICDQVFDVLMGLLRAEEIALVLKDEAGDLVPRALRRGAETLHDKDIPAGSVNLDDAAQAVEHHSLVKVIDGSTGIFCVPLIADKTPVGVMRFELTIEGTPEERTMQIDRYEFVLADIAKYLALVVKTPSLHDRAVIDGLTGLFTRRHFDVRISDLFRLARRYGSPFSLLLIDIDHFKNVNDTHGHRAGDVVLRETAALLTQGIRDCDSAFRYGGEEFAILLPETVAEKAGPIAERLRKAVKRNLVQAEDAEVSVTISLGVAEYGPELANHGELIAIADRALYQAKQAGRDRSVVITADEA